MTLVGHPFDTLKVRLQTQSMTNPTYSSLSDCFRKTVSKEGLAGLYKGVSSPLAGQMAFRATLFTSFAKSKDYLASGKKLGYSDFFVAGAATGGIVSFAEGPIDFYKSQVQVQTLKGGAPKSMADIVKESIKFNGIKGPFQGLGGTLLRNIPANSIYFGSFEVFKNQAAQYYNCKTSDLSMLSLFTMGGLAGSLYWACFFPCDVIKSTQQSDAIDPSKRTYSSIVNTASKIYKQGGVASFYRGFLPCMLRATPANGIMLMTVDKVRNLIDTM